LAIPTKQVVLVLEGLHKVHDMVKK
jgi:hypothetical protein